MNQKIVITTPIELQTLIQDAMNVAVQQITIPQKIDPLPEFLTIQEAATFLNLAVPTIYAKVSKRELPFIKKSKKLYFSKNSLTDYLSEGKNDTKLNIFKNLNTKKNGTKPNYAGSC